MDGVEPLSKTFDWQFESLLNRYCIVNTVGYNIHKPSKDYSFSSVGIALEQIDKSYRNFSKSAGSPRAIAWALGRAVYLLQT